MSALDDERVVWIRACEGRKIVQIIEPMPSGFSVITQWWERDGLFRQDCEVSIPMPVAADGAAAKLN